jgi:choice-of-anchor B domain-containing protein
MPYTHTCFLESKQGQGGSLWLAEHSGHNNVAYPNFSRSKEVDMTRRRSLLTYMRFSSTVAFFIITTTTLAGFPAENVVLRSHLPTDDFFGATFAEDCWGYVSESGREYAIIGLSNGTGFVEITDPDNPVIVKVIFTDNQGRDMKVYQNYVYSSSDSGPTHIIDVADIDSGVVTLVNTIDGGTHNIFINEESGFLYASVGGPMVVADLADPINPVFVGVWDSQAHDATVVTYAEGPYAGREIAFVFAGWNEQVDIVDVTDKSDMFLLGSTTYPSATYTHQGWPTADLQYLYVGDEVDGIPRTSIIDISDLSDPTFVSDFTTGLNSTDHNLYVHEDHIFEANYTSGLRIFNAADPVNPVEVGYFDTYPANNDPGFDGAWSVYPFYPSGMAIVSDRSGGLFVLDPSEAVAGGGKCATDLDGDGDVDATDLAQLLGAWGPNPGHPADFNGDGLVSASDLAELLGAWGPC